MPSSPIRKLAPFAAAAEGEGVKIYHLNIGQPDIPTPEKAIEAIRRISRTTLEYSPSQGFLSLRQAFSRYYSRYGITVDPEEIIVTSGGSFALLFTFMSCLDPGDEIIIPEPSYANYFSFAKSAGAVVRTVTSRIEDGFALPPVEEFEKMITPKTKAILICNTNNPTGGLYSPEEMQRLRHALQIIRKCQPQAIISVDTFRPTVARMVVEEFGVAIINDVSEGTGAMNIPPQDDDTEDMFRMVSALGVPYVLMSVRPDFTQTLKTFARKVNRLRALGVKDIILDPGFGFGKTLEQNYALLAVMERLQVMQLPLLVGVSRKSMAYRLLECSPAEALNASTVLHTIALEKGASILRVHDVREAVEVCRIVEKMNR